MKHSTLAGLVGRTGQMSVQMSASNLRIPVTIHDTREVWGRRDVLVEPLGGSGTAWVDVGRIDLDPREET